LHFVILFILVFCFVLLALIVLVCCFHLFSLSALSNRVFARATFALLAILSPLVKARALGRRDDR
jgi:hypothetical protein